MDTLRTNVSRRSFIEATSVVAGAIALGALASPDVARAATKTSGIALADLPKGEAPQPLSLPHFPDRLHAFVWRNWPLVPAERMARVVGANTSEILRMGHAMGLSGSPRIAPQQRARSYITVIKRNWHLLPYEQLLELLDWTAEKLAYTLREDDFLFVKLGNLKPQCKPLRYQSPGQSILDQERAIARVIREEFPPGEVVAGEPLFGFIEKLSGKPNRRQRLAGVAASPPGTPALPGDLKFCYSYFALYGDPLLEPASDPYPEGYLERLAQAGVTGVWLQAVLYKMSPFPWQPELSEQYQTRLKNLRALVRRAARHGIRVFLYLNEPRAMPVRFFEDRADLKGVVEGDHAALCTSEPEVQQFIVSSVAAICRAVPGFGGFFSITASENLTNCWSHGQGAKCPRCATRPPAEVIAEVNRLFLEGIKQSGVSARLIAWDWGWNDAWAGEVIRRLPAGVALMSVSEWRLPVERGGVKSEVGEYSISAIGPGPRAQHHWQIARERGLETIAKIQAGNTWELSAVPYIPALENVARHGENLRRADINGVMLGWTLGGYPSPNLEVVSEALVCGSAEEAMRRVAERRFGKSLAPKVVVAWRRLSAAFREYPFHVGVLYSGPQQLGPANLLWGEPTGYRASMVGFPYDDLDAWRAVYPSEIFIQQLDKVADGFTSALEELRDSAASAQGPVSPAEHAALNQECRIAQAAAIHFRSAANQARFVVARRALTGARTQAESTQQVAMLERVLNDEIGLARKLHLLQSSDSSIGFEASNHYFYVPVDLAEKTLNCRHLLVHWLPRFK